MLAPTKRPRRLRDHAEVAFWGSAIGAWHHLNKLVAGDSVPWSCRGEEFPAAFLLLCRVPDGNQGNFPDLYGG
jgi:hypothetical protein